MHPISNRNLGCYSTVPGYFQCELPPRIVTQEVKTGEHVTKACYYYSCIFMYAINNGNILYNAIISLIHVEIFQKNIFLKKTFRDLPYSKYCVVGYQKSTMLIISGRPYT